jgi:steroid delta-isomerase-like uncharacterized protein
LAEKWSAETGGFREELLNHNTNLVHRYYGELLSAPGDLEVAEQIFTPDIIFTNPVEPKGVHGIEEYKTFANRWKVGFADRKFSVDETVTEGDKVAARFTIDACHSGEFMGAQATGKMVHIVGINLFRMRDGRICRVEAVWDPRQLWEPLGVTGAAATIQAQVAR